jgi:glycosyltransferase involved in cell wall biosynthesis
MSSVLYVCIPVFNHAEFVAEAVERILRQTVAALEIVLSDHSTYETDRVVSEFAPLTYRLQLPKQEVYG